MRIAPLIVSASFVSKTIKVMVTSCYATEPNSRFRAWTGNPCCAGACTRLLQCSSRRGQRGCAGQACVWRV